MDANGGHFSTLRGKQGNSTIFYTNDGFQFLCYKRTDSARYFRCIKHKVGCCMRAIYSVYTSELRFTGQQHTHTAQHSEIDCRSARISLIGEATRLDIASLQDIFNDPRNINGPFADQLSYHRLQPSLSRARKQALPTCETLIQLITALENPIYNCITATQNFEDVLYRGFARAQDGSLVALFMGRRSADLRVLPSVFVFLTSVPISDLKYHICTVGGRWDCSVLSLAWCVMDTVTYEAFFAAFLLLRGALTSWQFCKATCGVHVVSHAFSLTFNVPVNPSLYDYIFDVKQFLETTLTMPFVQQCPQLSHIVKLCCALPLLPKDALQIGISVIIAEANGRAVSHQTSGLFGFIEEHWLKNQQRSFSVCGDTERTDYGSEDLKLIINAKIIKNNVDCYCLTSFMVSTTQEEEKSITAAFEGQRRRN